MAVLHAGPACHVVDKLVVGGVRVVLEGQTDDFQLVFVSSLCLFAQLSKILAHCHTTLYRSLLPTKAHFSHLGGVTRACAVGERLSRIHVYTQGGLQYRTGAERPGTIPHAPRNTMV